MTARAGETVEFLDVGVPRPDEVDPGTRPDDDPGRPPRARSLLLAALLVAGVLVAARSLGAPPRPAAAVPAPAPVFGGAVDLPPDFGAPVALAAPTGAADDVVFVLGAGGRVARVVDGVVAAVSVGRGYGTLAVRPDGRGVFVSTGRLAPAVVALDPVALSPLTSVSAMGRWPTPVTAIAAGVGSVWAVTSAGVQGWTSDLSRPLRTITLPDSVTRVRSLAVVRSSLQALVTTTPGTSAVLGLEPPGGGWRSSPPYTGPVSLVPGPRALLAHLDQQGTVEVVSDPAGPAAGLVDRPFLPDASVWPVVGAGRAVWAVSSRGSAALECFDATDALVGRMAVGDTGVGVRGPVVTTSRAVYGVTVRGGLARGGHGSCG